MKNIYITILSIFTFQLGFSQGVISKPSMVLPNHSDDVTSLAYAPYGKIIASGSWDNSINIYSDEGKFIRSIKKHSAAVEALSFSRDGKFLFSGSNDFSAMQFDANTGNALNVFSRHTANVTDLTVDAANKYLFTGSDDGTIKLWDLTQNGSLFKTITIGSPVHQITIANDGKSFYVAANSKDVIQYDMAGKELRRLVGHTDFVNGVALSLNNKYIVTAGNDKKIIVWDAKAGTKLKELTNHTLKINCVTLSFDGKYIISGSNDGTCRVWETESGKELYTLNDMQDNKIRAALISFDKRKIYTAAKMKNQADYGVRIWNFPIDSIEKNVPKTQIGTGSKDDKSTGLNESIEKAKPAPATTTDKSNPKVSTIVKPGEGGPNIKTVDSAKVTMVPDSEAMRRTGKNLGKPNTAKPGTATTTPAKPGATSGKPETATTPAKPGATSKPETTTTTPTNVITPGKGTAPSNAQKPADITNKTPANATNNAPMSKTDKIKQAQLEKERKEKEEKDRLEKEKLEKAKQAPVDTVDEEEAKPKSKFKKLR